MLFMKLMFPKPEALKSLKAQVQLFMVVMLCTELSMFFQEIPDEQLLKIGAEYGTTEWYRHLATYGDIINDEHAFCLI